MGLSECLYDNITGPENETFLPTLGFVEMQRQWPGYRNPGCFYPPERASHGWSPPNPPPPPPLRRGVGPPFPFSRERPLPPPPPPPPPQAPPTDPRLRVPPPPSAQAAPSQKKRKNRKRRKQNRAPQAADGAVDSAVVAQAATISSATAAETIQPPFPLQESAKALAVDAVKEAVPSSTKESPPEAEKDEHKAALEKAKRTLLKAKLKKAVAAKRQKEAELARLQAAQPVHSISACRKGGLDSLVITQIRSSGPPERVNFVQSTAVDFDDDEEALEDGALLTESNDVWYETPNMRPHVDGNSEYNLEEQMELVRRKMALAQSEAEASQVMARTSQLSKQELLQRKKAAEERVLLMKRKQEATESRLMLEKHKRETERTKEKLRLVQATIAKLQEEEIPAMEQEQERLDIREQVLQEMLSETLEETLAVRKELAQEEEEEEEEEKQEDM